MLKLTLHPVELPLRHVWTIAHGTRTVQRNLIVALHDTDTGHTGYGEAPGIPYLGVTIESMLQRFMSDPSCYEWGWERWIVNANYHLDERQNWSELEELFNHEPAYKTPTSERFVCCAMDQALHDLIGKNECISSRDRLTNNENKHCVSNYTLGMAEPDVVVAKLHEYPDFPVYKIKLGSPPEAGGTDRDLELVRHLRMHTDAAFRVDANTAWTAEQTIRMSGPLRDLGVEFIEQPLPPETPRSEHDAVYFGSDLPIMADESCQTEDDVEKCAGLFHGINIKLCKCGGMSPARRMIARARELDLKVMMGCMTETTVGISALAQFLPLLDYVDMDGALLLAEDIAEGVRLGPDGVALFPEGEAAHGNGVRLRRELPGFRA
ncbi:MAG: dipeptide epimerase [Planctomycetota bacterium]